MTDYNVKLNKDDMVALLSENNALAHLVESILNQVLEAQMTQHLGADRYSHTDSREGYRNGYRERKLYTRIGTLTLRVPQTRDGSFSTEIFRRYQRSEQAFVLGLMEMYLQGVSTRKVSKITEELCGVSFSKSTVSQLTVELDARLKAWRTRPLSTQRYPFLIVDALVIDVRRNDAIRSTGVLIAYGINEQGLREPLDLLIADTESFSSWDELFKKLKGRGINTVDFVVSDAHEGLVAALKKNFQGASWQRCQVHFMRNVLGLSPRQHRGAIASDLKLIFQASNKEMALSLAKQFIARYEKQAVKSIDCFERGFEDALAIIVLPERYRRRLRTTNLAERMNEEIRRRQRVIRIFPNEESAVRLIGALLADQYEAWHTGVRYFEMQDYWDWRKDSLESRSINEKVIAIA